MKYDVDTNTLDAVRALSEPSIRTNLSRTHSIAHTARRQALAHQIHIRRVGRRTFVRLPDTDSNVNTHRDVNDRTKVVAPVQTTYLVPIGNVNTRPPPID